MTLYEINQKQLTEAWHRWPEFRLLIEEKMRWGTKERCDQIEDEFCNPTGYAIARAFRATDKRL